MTAAIKQALNGTGVLILAASALVWLLSANLAQSMTSVADPTRLAMLQSLLDQENIWAAALAVVGGSLVAAALFFD